MFSSIALLIAKFAFKDKVQATGSFIESYWSLAAVFVLLITTFVLLDQRNNARDELKDFKQQIQAAADTRKAENAILKKQGEDKVKEIEADRDKQLIALGLLKVELAKSKQNESELKNENINIQEQLGSLRANLTTSMQLATERYRAGMSEKSADSGGVAGSESVCDAASYRELYEACQLTTIDFNTCRLALDNDTALCGREVK